MIKMPIVQDIREEFVRLYSQGHFVIDKTGVPVVEIINAAFIANEDHIFGVPNQDYIARELEWYKSQSRNVHDIPGSTPQIWLMVADNEGNINSNYGWCIYSEENGNQYANVLEELKKNPFSRRAEMIYTRPNMHTDYKRGGMSDFVCTEAVQYFIRDNLLHACVKMRSNDAIFGFNNDFAWQKFVQIELMADLHATGMDNLRMGNLYWNAGSLHVYQRHFKFIEEFIE